jgi:hypothetical protein
MEDFRVLTMSNFQFVKIVTVKAMPYFRMYTKFCPQFVHFSSDLHEVCYKRCPQNCTEWSGVLWKWSHWRSYFALGRKFILILFVLIFLSDLVEIRYKKWLNAVKDLWVLWARHREGCCPYTAVNEIKFVYHDVVGYFENPERPCKVCVLRHWTHHSQSCSLSPNACYIPRPPYHL